MPRLSIFLVIANGPLSQLLFLWPKDGPSIEESLGHQLEALDIIRAGFGYHVFIPKGQPDCICVLGNSLDIIRQIVSRLRTKWSETIATSNVKSKAYIVELPEANFMKRDVIIKNNSRVAKPFLHGDAPSDTELSQWRSRAALVNSRNNARLLSAVDKSLRGIMFVRGHLRLRVNFGSFVLDNYRVPKYKNPAYSFEEFREMLLHEDTKGRLIPGYSIPIPPITFFVIEFRLILVFHRLKPSQDELLCRCFKASDLLRPFESSTSWLLKDAEPAYSVNFEFLGSNNALLRLEAEFAKHPGAQDYEVTQRRWLRLRKNGHSNDTRPPLQVAVVDFQRYVSLHDVFQEGKLTRRSGRTGKSK